MSNAYRPSKDLQRLEPLCCALAAAGATEAQACELLALALIEERERHRRYVESSAVPVVIYVPAERGE